MQCNRLTLVNFCRHRQRVFEFHGGLTAIIGPNGTGKSNIMGGVGFALTGVNPYNGNKIANICDRAPVTEVSYVELDFSHGSINAVVRRNFRPARPTAVLTINGVEVIEGDIEVTNRIEQILGITTDIINDIVIVAQDEIFGFLDKTPTKRAEQFQKLFRTEQAGVLHKLIGEQLKTVEIPTVGVDRDNLRTMINDSTQSLAVLEHQLCQFPTFDVIQQQRDAAAATVRQYDDLLRSQHQLETVSQQHQMAHTSYAQAQQQAAAAAIERQTIADARAGITTAVDAAKITLATLANTKQQLAARSRAAERITFLQQQQTTLLSQAPVIPPNYVSDIKACEARHLQAHNLLSQHEQLVNSLSGNMVACPTCQTPAESLLPRLETSRLAIPPLRKMLTELVASINASREYDRQLAVFNTARTGLDQQLAAANAQLNDLPVTTQQDINETELNAVLVTDKTFAAGLVEYDQAISSHNMIVGRCEGQLTTLQAQINQLQAQITTMPVYTTVQRDQAQQQVVNLDMTASQRRQTELSTATERANLTRFQEQLAAANQLAGRADMLRGWHTEIGRVRDVFHKDAAPRFVAQRNLEWLQYAMNDNLAMFDTNYRVTADEGLSFTASFTDGSRQPAERLSGGQKVVLALAFRLALNLMFAENIGAIYLDEPTAWLDEHHIRGFEPVLQRLREFSAARGLQSIIITHERELAPLFDSVISL